MNITGVCSLDSSERGYPNDPSAKNPLSSETTLLTRRSWAATSASRPPQEWPAAATLDRSSRW